MHKQTKAALAVAAVIVVALVGVLLVNQLRGDDDGPVAVDTASEELSLIRGCRHGSG